MRPAVKSLILTGGLVSFGKFLRANYLCISRLLVRECIFSLSEAPRPGRVVLVPLVFDFRGGRHIHDVLVVSFLSWAIRKAVELRLTTNVNMQHKY
jgi:hypothetical protein